MAAQTKKAFVPVAKTSDLKDGAMKEYKVGEQEILVVRVGDKYYATDNICPHLGARLVRGTLEGTIVTCPRHASKFDVTDGRVIRWTDWTGIKGSVSKLFRAPRPITVYQVKIEGEDILVQV